MKNFPVHLHRLLARRRWRTGLSFNSSMPPCKRMYCEIKRSLPPTRHQRKKAVGRVCSKVKAWQPWWMNGRRFPWHANGAYHEHSELLSAYFFCVGCRFLLFTSYQHSSTSHDMSKSRFLHWFSGLATWTVLAIPWSILFSTWNSEQLFNAYYFQTAWRVLLIVITLINRVEPSQAATLS